MADVEKKIPDAKSAPADAAVREAIERGVAAWKSEHLMNSLFSQDTPAWNHFSERLPALVDAIAKEV